MCPFLRSTPQDEPTDAIIDHRWPRFHSETSAKSTKGYPDAYLSSVTAHPGRTSWPRGEEDKRRVRSSHCPSGYLRVYLATDSSLTQHYRQDRRPRVRRGTASWQYLLRPLYQAPSCSTTQDCQSDPPTMRNTSRILQRLYSLHTSSLDFIRYLHFLIQYDKEEEYLTNLQEPELTRLLDFLDKVRVFPSTFRRFRDRLL